MAKKKVKKGCDDKTSDLSKSTKLLLSVWKHYDIEPSHFRYLYNTGRLGGLDADIWIDYLCGRGTIESAEEVISSAVGQAERYQKYGFDDLAKKGWVMSKAELDEISPKMSQIGAYKGKWKR